MSQSVNSHQYEDPTHPAIRLHSSAELNKHFYCHRYHNDTDGSTIGRVWAIRHTLDAETRLEIDTTASNQILYVRKEMDSICRDYERQNLKALVDSIKKVREEEIARQLKTIPR